MHAVSFSLSLCFSICELIYSFVFVRRLLGICAFQFNFFFVLYDFIFIRFSLRCRRRRRRCCCFSAFLFWWFGLDKNSNALQLYICVCIICLCICVRWLWERDGASRRYYSIAVARNVISFILFFFRIQFVRVCSVWFHFFPMCVGFHFGPFTACSCVCKIASVAAAAAAVFTSFTLIHIELSEICLFVVWIASECGASFGYIHTSIYKYILPERKAANGCCCSYWYCRCCLGSYRTNEPSYTKPKHTLAAHTHTHMHTLTRTICLSHSQLNERNSQLTIAGFCVWLCVVVLYVVGSIWIFIAHISHSYSVARFDYVFFSICLWFVSISIV